MKSSSTQKNKLTIQPIPTNPWEDVFLNLRLFSKDYMAYARIDNPPETREPLQPNQNQI